MTIDEITQEIINFDCEPSVFQVHIIKASYKTGFTVLVEFRTYDKTALSSITTHNDSLMDALETALANLKTKFGKCPYCHQYMHGKEE